MRKPDLLLVGFLASSCGNPQQGQEAAPVRQAQEKASQPEPSPIVKPSGERERLKSAMLAEAQEALEKGRYTTALEILNRFPALRRDPDIARLRATAENAAQAEPRISKEVCQAALKSILSYSAFGKYLRSYGEGGKIIHVFRSPDALDSTYKCYVNGDRVMWGVHKAPTITAGRWRNHPADERIRYEVKGNRVVIIQEYSDGSQSEDIYDLSLLASSLR